LSRPKILIRRNTGINARIIIEIIIRKMLSVLKKLSLVISKLRFNDSNGPESSSTMKQTQNIERDIKYNTISNSKS
jgi:bifunctional DNA-binding transcriptional regulator/antitoxin component of YhaV-PrlF toxin-antitoxin module